MTLLFSILCGIRSAALTQEHPLFSFTRPRFSLAPKGLFGWNGSVPFGDRFHSKKRVHSVLKRKETDHLYGGTERNRSNRTGSKNTTNREYSITPLYHSASSKERKMSHAIHDNNNCFNNTNCNNNVWNNCTIADDRPLLLAWLSPLEPKLRHRDIQERRVDNVGNGFFKLRNSEAGMPGVGKVNVIRQSCFATEAREPARHLSGNENYPREREENQC